MIDLLNPEHAYFFGFALADGHLSEDSRNRGRLSIELQETDRCILERFAGLFPVSSSLSARERNTNFKDKHRSVVLRFYDKQFRDSLRELGYPSRRKSEVVSKPWTNFSKQDFFRGLIDADGALGLTAGGFPFLSLITRSEKMAVDYLAFVQGITGKVKQSSRNKRDAAFNIAVYKEDAQQVIQVLYPVGCLALPRKYNAAMVVLGWERPQSMRRITSRKPWTSEQDHLIQTVDLATAMHLLGRSEKSIKVRLWRLSQGVTA